MWLTDLSCTRVPFIYPALCLELISPVCLTKYSSFSFYVCSFSRLDSQLKWLLLFPGPFLSLRYKAIVKPMDIQASKASLKVCLRAASIWLLSMILAIPEVVFSDLHTFHIPETNETFKACAPYPHAGDLHPKIHSMASFLILYIIPLFIISVYYIFIARSLIQSAINLPVEGNAHIRRQVSLKMK